MCLEGCALTVPDKTVHTASWFVWNANLEWDFYIKILHYNNDDMHIAQFVTLVFDNCLWQYYNNASGSCKLLVCEKISLWLWYACTYYQLADDDVKSKIVLASVDSTPHGQIGLIWAKIFTWLFCKQHHHHQTAYKIWQKFWN
jgi:hypothetical protein